MISIITEGKGRFKATCDRCLCVFEYDWSDLETFVACEYVSCPCCGCSVAHKPEVGDAPKSEVIKEFVKRFEGYIGNCTFSMGQTNDIQYALKKATEEMEGGE